MSSHEQPSVEDILASIKQVIARDSRDAAAARFAGPERRPEPVDEDEAEDILELSSEAEIEDREEDVAPAPLADSGLVNEQARANMRESLAALAMLAEPGAKPQIVRSGETSLEGLVREMLRPMLAEWLDRNLPTMVEQLVQAEIARIAGKKS